MVSCDSLSHTFTPPPTQIHAPHNTLPPSLHFLPVCSEFHGNLPPPRAPAMQLTSVMQRKHICTSHLHNLFSMQSFCVCVCLRHQWDWRVGVLCVSHHPPSLPLALRRAFASKSNHGYFSAGVIQHKGMTSSPMS